MEGRQYEISTLADIAKLEQDQIERLCAELPRHFEYARAMQDLMGVAADALGESFESSIVSPLIWIDDGKQDLNMTMVNSETGDEICQFNKNSPKE